MGEIIIQEEISITKEEFNKVIDHYRKMPDTFGMGIGGKMLNSDGIVKEIKELTDIGKQIILVGYKYEKLRRLFEKE